MVIFIIFSDTQARMESLLFESEELTQGKRKNNKLDNIPGTFGDSVVTQSVPFCSINYANVCLSVLYCSLHFLFEESKKNENINKYLLKQENSCYCVEAQHDKEVD